MAARRTRTVLVASTAVAVAKAPSVATLPQLRPTAIRGDRPRPASRRSGPGTVTHGRAVCRRPPACPAPRRSARVRAVAARRWTPLEDGARDSDCGRPLAIASVRMLAVTVASPKHPGAGGAPGGPAFERRSVPPGSSPPSALRPVTVIVPIAGRPEALV